MTILARRVWNRLNTPMQVLASLAIFLSFSAGFIGALSRFTASAVVHQLEHSDMTNYFLTVDNHVAFSGEVARQLAALQTHMDRGDEQTRMLTAKTRAEVLSILDSNRVDIIRIATVQGNVTNQLTEVNKRLAKFAAISHVP